MKLMIIAVVIMGLTGTASAETDTDDLLEIYLESITTTYERGVEVFRSVVVHAEELLKNVRRTLASVKYCHFSVDNPEDVGPRTVLVLRIKDREQCFNAISQCAGDRHLWNVVYSSRPDNPYVEICPAGEDA